MAAPRELGVYRRCDPDEALRGPVQRPLVEACDALHLALLCLEGQDSEDTPHGRLRTAAQARSFLAEAVASLNRARVYLPEVFTYTTSVIAASEPDPGAELARLHQIATRLIWYNHRLLPARREAPLSAKDEAQLAVVFRALARTARAGRALRHAWVAAAIALALLLPLGPGAVSAGLAALLAIACTLQAAAALRPALRPERAEC